MRARVLVPILAAVVVIAGLSLYALRSDPPPPAAVSPTPTATPTAAPSPAPSADPTPTPVVRSSPSPTARPAQTSVGRYVSADMGYALELPSPWHRSSCGSSVSGGPAVGTDGNDLFIPIPDADFTLGHVGPFGGNADAIHVFAAANPDARSPREWRRRSGGSSNAQLTDTTFLGHPALLVTEPNDPGAGRGQAETFIFANAGYMWEVGHRLIRGSTALADRVAIVRSFRFLDADEVRAARAAATPSPAPRTPEQVVDVLADGFAKRDVTILARVIRPCFYEGVYGAGPSSMVGQAYLERLRQRSAQGLVVEVRARPISGDAGTTLRARSTWREPGQPIREADLILSVHRGTTYWDGTITCAIGPCP